MKFRPHPYQDAAIQFALDTPKCALWMEMGLGKTVTTLTAIEDMLASFRVRKVLIAAPLRVAQSVWPQEIAKWDHTRWLRHESILVDPSITSTQDRRDAMRRACRSPFPIHLVNYENLYWLYEELLADWDYDMIVVDESSKVKNHKALRTRVLKTYQDRTDRMVQLTGTPAPNGYHDLWAQAYLLDKGARLYDHIGKYRTAHFDKYFDGNRDTYRLKNGHDEIINGKLRDICLSIRTEAEEPIHNIVPVRLPPRAFQRYKTLENDLIAELDSGLVIEAANAAVATGKCLQFANGAMYTDENAREWEAVHDAKIDGLKSVVGEAAGKPVLVGVSFRSDWARIKAAFPEARYLDKNPQTLVDWNAGEIPLLVAHPASAGHGLNMQWGGNIVCWYGLNWSLELWEQLIERVGPTRQKQAGFDRPVFVHYLVAQGTLDEAVLDRLLNKRDVQDALKDALRRHL